MAEVTTDRTINPTQLGIELGRIPLRVRGPDPDGTTRVESDAVTEATLRAACDAHVADPDYVDPDPVVSEAATIIAKGRDGYLDLIAIAKDTSQPAAARRVARDTAYALRAIWTAVRDIDPDA